MKRILPIVLVLIFCLSLFACASSPKERLSEGVEKHMCENYRITKGSAVSKPVGVEIIEIVDVKENEWAVLGTYTVKLGGTTMSSKFAISADYNEAKDSFSFSEATFEGFK